MTTSFSEVSLDFEGLENVNILLSFKDNIIVTTGQNIEWDDNIREIGNIVYHPIFNKYFFFYSGYIEEYFNNNVFIGMAYSFDGKNFTKYGKIFDTPAEDPYAVIYDNAFYLFFEDKSQIPYRKIDLAVSLDGINWTIHKKGVVEPSKYGWQSKDVSSPVVFNRDNEWIMLYEGRGAGNQGQIGYATSADLVNWTKKDDPVVFKRQDAWSTYIVPDDVMAEGSNYLLSYHGSNGNSIWHSGLAISKDLINWEAVNPHPLHPISTLMMTTLDSQVYFFGCTGDQVEFFIPLMGKE